MSIMKMYFGAAIALFATVLGAEAQDSLAIKQAEYKKAIASRSDKIVDKLNIKDAALYKEVSQAVAEQYFALNDIYISRDSTIKLVKETAGTDKALLDSGKARAERTTTAKVDIQHKVYLNRLAKLISNQQIEQVKDGMTYGVLPLTYKAYQDMIPTLTEPQKAQILTWLTEAREHAMDAESSDKKHAWFGKYKGRINNYLSAQGYDSKKEREEWEKRIKAEAAAKKTN